MKALILTKAAVLLSAVVYSQTSSSPLPATGAIPQMMPGSGQVVTSVNGLKDDIKLLAGTNVTISQSGNSLIFSTGHESTGAVGSSLWNLTGDHISSINPGNIGIGTTKPDSKLHVWGDVHLQEPAGIFFNGGPSDPNYYLKPYSATNEWGMRLNGFSGVRLSTGQGDILNVFQDKVGIGTTNPSHLLEVSGSGSEAGIHITNAANHSPVLRFRKGSTDKWGLFVSDGDDDNLYIVEQDQKRPIISIPASGKPSYISIGHHTHIIGELGVSQDAAIQAWFNVGKFAGSFLGPVEITGNLTKTSGSFKIDHPLDPANKFLYHSFVESPDMMNIYNGIITTDAYGDATVVLPDWFEALNMEFRYQLTPIGQFAQAIISEEVLGNQFRIKTDKPNVKISWQVTGIRHDAYAEKHRIAVEEDKTDAERGSYLHPDVFGQPASLSISPHPKRVSGAELNSVVKK